MKLTSSVSYAVSILLQVHGGRGEGPMTAARISSGCKFPPRFLYRVLRRLVDAGLMTGVSGPGGGYALAKPPQKINLLEIVAAVEGPLEASRLTAVCSRHRSAIRLVNEATEQMTERNRRELAKVKLTRLIGTVKQPAARKAARPAARRKRAARA